MFLMLNQQQKQKVPKAIADLIQDMKDISSTLDKYQTEHSLAQCIQCLQESILECYAYVKSTK